MIKIHRNGDGSAFQSPKGQFVFVKDGVNFALSSEQMEEMLELINGLKDGSLINVDPKSDHMLRKR